LNLKEWAGQFAVGAEKVVVVAKKAGAAVVDALTVEMTAHHTNEELKRRAEINARGDEIRAARAAALDRLMGGPQPWIRPTRGWLMRGR